jgi:hypothetical protein
MFRWDAERAVESRRKFRDSAEASKVVGYPRSGVVRNDAATKLLARTQKRDERTAALDRLGRKTGKDTPAAVPHHGEIFARFLHNRAVTFVADLRCPYTRTFSPLLTNPAGNAEGIQQSRGARSSRSRLPSRRPLPEEGGVKRKAGRRKAVTSGPVSRSSYRADGRQ